jgi:hypothetical protein
MASLTRTNPTALATLAGQFDGPRVLKVGFLKGATYPISEDAPEGLSVAQVAAWNEFGVPVHNQPPRPFFRLMIVAQAPKWGKLTAALLKANNHDVDVVLDIMGQEIQGRIKESINALMTPELAASTIAKKGFDKPLIHHAIMVNAANYEVLKP